MGLQANEPAEQGSVLGHRGSGRDRAHGRARLGRDRLGDPDWPQTRYDLCLDGTWTNPHKNEYERAWVLLICLRRYEELCIEHGHVEDYSRWERWPEAIYHRGLMHLCERLGICERT